MVKTVFAIIFIVIGALSMIVGIINSITGDKFYDELMKQNKIMPGNDTDVFKLTPRTVNAISAAVGFILVAVGIIMLIF